MLLDDLPVPIVLAPLAGGSSTPELAAAVSNAGGLGFLGSGYLRAEELAARLDEAVGLTGGPLGVNLFYPGEDAGPGAELERYEARLRPWAEQLGYELGAPGYSDDDWQAKLELLIRRPVAVVSFTFGCPSTEVIDDLRQAGSEAWVTVTSPSEAELAEEAGADVLVVQGAEAGGHRASFEDHPGLPVYGLLPLLTLTRSRCSLPLVASGGIADGRGVAAVLCAGARAAQLGTAFMLADEAGTSPAHRAALRDPGETVLTRAFTGRLARGIANRFIAEHESHAPLAYPQVHYLTAPLRRRARETEDAGLINLWAGEAHELAQELPAAEIVAQLRRGMVEAERSLQRRPPA